MIQQQFENHLKNLKVSANSLKNYRSDLRHFMSYAKIQDLSECIPYLSYDFAIKYKEHLISNNAASKTTNRRLSTLRKLSKFLHSIEAIDFDFSKRVTNISKFNHAQVKKSDFNKLLTEYKSHLLASNVSKNTIKNYLSDTRHFLSWLDNN